MHDAFEAAFVEAVDVAAGCRVALHDLAGGVTGQKRQRAAAADGEAADGGAPLQAGDLMSAGEALDGHPQPAFLKAAGADVLDDRDDVPIGGGRRVRRVLRERGLAAGRAVTDDRRAVGGAEHDQSRGACEHSRAGRRGAGMPALRGGLGIDVHDALTGAQPGDEAHRQLRRWAALLEHHAHARSLAGGERDGSAATRGAQDAEARSGAGGAAHCDAQRVIGGDERRAGGQYEAREWSQSAVVQHGNAPLVVGDDDVGAPVGVEIGDRQLPVALRQGVGDRDRESSPCAGAGDPQQLAVAVGQDRVEAGAGVQRRSVAG